VRQISLLIKHSAQLAFEFAFQAGRFKKSDIAFLRQNEWEQHLFCHCRNFHCTAIVVDFSNRKTSNAKTAILKNAIKNSGILHFFLF